MCHLILETLQKCHLTPRHSGYNYLDLLATGTIYNVSACVDPHTPRMGSEVPAGHAAHPGRGPCVE